MIHNKEAVTTRPKAIKLLNRTARRRIILVALDIGLLMYMLADITNFGGIELKEQKRGVN